MISGILFQIMQLYKICQFTDETTILDVILPGITPKEFSASIQIGRIPQFKIGAMHFTPLN